MSRFTNSDREDLFDWSRLPIEFTQWLLSYMQLGLPTKVFGSTLATGLNGAPGAEVAYQEFTANVSITATTEATANTIVTAPSVVFDGVTKVVIEFSAVTANTPAAGNTLLFYLFQDGASIGPVGAISSSAGSVEAPIMIRRPMVPTAGAHVYSLRGTNTAVGTSTVFVGAGGLGANNPGYIRITKA